MSVVLTITSPRLADEELQEMCRDLGTAVIRKTDVQVSAVEGPQVSGARGDPVTVGALLLTFITSGAAVALFNVVKTYFERDSSLEMKFERQDGKKLKIQARHFDRRRLDDTIKLAREFFEVEGKDG